MTGSYPTGVVARPADSGSGRIDRLLLLLASIAIAFVIAEVTELDRFLRTLIHGYLFWTYAATFFFGFALLFGLFLWRGEQGQPAPLPKLLFASVIIGFVSSLLGICLSPTLLGHGVRPAISALRDPVALLAAGLISSGWLSGALAAFVYDSLVSRNRRRLMVLLAVCLGVRGIELATHLILGERLW